MKLRQLCATDLRLDEPLPWNVYDASKKLLLCKGYVVTSASQFELLLERGMYVDEGDFQQADRRATCGPSPFVLVEQTQARLGEILLHFSSTANLQADVEDCAERVRTLVQGNPDVSISRAVLARGSNYAVSHKISVAIIVQLLSQRLGWSQTEQQQGVCAALTMNVAMLELQNHLYHQHAPLSNAQRNLVRQHSHRGYEALQQAGVERPDWLVAVRDHHETRTGLGYPQGRSDSSEMAEIIRYADIYCAKVAGRAYRKPLLPNIAARDLYLVQDSEPVNRPLIQMMIKEIGMYPPGTFVKLANGDTAIVTQRGEMANAPYVHSLCDQSGWVFEHPPRRDTRQATYRILFPVQRDNVLVSVPEEKVWGPSD